MSEIHRDADLDRALAAAAAETDRDIAASGAATRVSAGVLARIARPVRRIPWFAIAAALVLAAGLGSIADLTLVAPAADDPGQNVVLLDPMVFGPTEVDAQ
jgi:hypothetical protein